jgi:signal peptidase I
MQMSDQPNSNPQLPQDAPEPKVQPTSIANGQVSNGQAGAAKLEAPAHSTEENPLVEGLKTIGLSIVLALGIRTFVAEARYIPSESMVPTLEVNDRLIVEKISYHFNPPRRGDIVVFSPTERLRADNPSLNDAFIKRVIGLPGEEVQVTNRQVFINGEPIDEIYIPPELAPEYDFGPEIIPEGEYLVLGDNRNNSYDSHFWGNVPRSNIIGRAAVRFWPLDRVGSIGPLPNFEDAPAEAENEAGEPQPAAN